VSSRYVLASVFHPDTLDSPLKLTLDPRGTGLVAFAVSLSLMALGCGGADEATPPRTAGDLGAEVEIFLASYFDAIGARDAETLRSQVADSTRYTWAEDGEVRYRSVDGMLEGLATFPPDVPIHTDLSDLTVAQVGTDGAYATASFVTRIGEGPDSFTFGGFITFVLERHNETWRIVGGHVSSPRQR